MRVTRIFLLVLTLILGAFQVQSSIPATLGPQAHVELVGEPLPHDPKAFTEGLLMSGSYLYESNGLVGQSDFRKLELQSGSVMAQTHLNPNFFGEGLAILDGRFYQLTWKNGVGLIYDSNTLEALGNFPVQGEGWGLTSDGQSLVSSDGSANLTWHAPLSFAAIKSVQVTLQGQPVAQLNELEYIDGFIYANIFLTDNILRIDPTTGKVLTVIDAAALRPESTKTDINSVLNGIAWDSSTKSLYLTGKNWPVLYKVKIVDGPALLTAKQP
jgi:glutamine cyclotransferase